MTDHRPIGEGITGADRRVRTYFGGSSLTVGRG